MNEAASSHGNRLLDALLRECPNLRGRFESLDYPLGQVVVAQDQPLKHVYFPAGAALLSTLVQLDGGDAAEVMTIGSEGFVGLPIWLGLKTSLELVVQQGAGTVLRLAARQFCQGIEGSRRATTLLKHVTAYHLRYGHQTAVCNAYHSVEQRTCRWLLSMADRMGADSIRLSQALLAHMLGVRRQSVGEATVKLQRAKLISYHRMDIDILDRRGLERRACECHRVLHRAYDNLIGALL